MRVILASLFLLLSAPAWAAPITADLSSHQVEIHSGFTGTELLLFGARNDPGDIVVIVRGPSRHVIIRKKERAAGIWVNRGEARFHDIPLFYAIASSKPLKKLKEHQLFTPLEIKNLSTDTKSNHYELALERIMKQNSLYAESAGEVEFMGETLFKTRFSFPDNMPRGTYTAEIYLFSDGQLSGVQSIPVQVYKTGFDAFLYDAAHEHRLLYGLISVLLALSIGWFAGWLFQRI